MEWIQNGAQWIAVLSGEIDHHAARTAREAIDAAIGRHRIRQLALDFGKVTFMDSSGIGLIMGRYRIMNEVGGTLRVIHCSQQMEKLMRLAGVGMLHVLASDQEGRKENEKADQ